MKSNQRKKGLSLIQKIQPVQTSKRSEANSSQMTNRTQMTKKNPLISKKKGYSASICTEMNQAQPVIYEKNKSNHDVSQVTMSQNQHQFIELDLLNNSSVQQHCLINSDMVGDHAIQSEMIDCHESTQRLEETIEKSLSATEMQQVLPFSDEDLEEENMPNDIMNYDQYVDQDLGQNQTYEQQFDEQNFVDQDQDFDIQDNQHFNQEEPIFNDQEQTNSSGPSFENFKNLPLEQLSKEQLLQIMHNIPQLLSNEINKVKQSQTTTNTNQTMTFESNPVPINNLQDQQLAHASQDAMSIKQQLNMITTQNLNESSMVNIESGTITPSYPRTPSQFDISQNQNKSKKAVTKRKGAAIQQNKQIYQRIKQLNNEKYLLLRQLCLQKQIDENLNSIMKEKNGRRMSPEGSRYTSLKKATKQKMKKFNSKSKSRNKLTFQKENMIHTESNARTMKNQTVRPQSKNWNRTQEDLKKIKKSKQMLSQTGNKGRTTKHNKENENLETEPQFSFCFGSRNKEIDQLTNRYHSYLQNKDSKRSSYMTSAFSSRKRSQRSQRSYSKSKRGSTSKNVFQPMTNRQLFEYGDMHVEDKKVQNTHNDLSTKTTERKYNLQKSNTISCYQNTDDQNLHFQSPNFKQKQTQCQCSFQEPEMIPEYEDEIRCEQNDWTDKENSQQTSEKCPHIPTAQFQDQEIDLNDDIKNDYEDEPLHKRNHEDDTSTNGSKMIQLNQVVSDDDHHPLSSHQNKESFANNFMTANYEHQQFLEYEDYVTKSQMFDQQVQLQSNKKPKKKKQKSRKNSKDTHRSRNRRIIGNGSIQSQQMSRNSSINYKNNDEKIEKYISDSLERKSKQRNRSHSSNQRQGQKCENDIYLNQDEINVKYNGKQTWFGNASTNSITVIPSRKLSKTKIKSQLHTRKGSLAFVRPTSKGKKKVKGQKQGLKKLTREQSHRPSRQVSLFSVPRLSAKSHQSADKKLNTQRFQNDNRKWNPFFNQNKTSNYQDSFRDLNMNAIRSHRTNNESNGPIQRLIKFKLNTQKAGNIDLEQKWFLMRKPKDVTSDEYNSLQRNGNNCFSENTWRNDTKIVYSGNDTNSLDDNSVRNQPIRKSEKIIKRISERLYNPNMKSSKHNQSMNLNTIQHLKSPPGQKMKKKRNKSEDIQKRGRQTSLGQQRLHRLEEYQKSKHMTIDSRKRNQSMNSRNSKKSESCQYVQFKARPFIQSKPFVVLKSTKKLTVPKGRQMMTQRMKNKEQQLLLKKARQNREMSQSKESQGSLGSGSKIRHFNPKSKKDESRPMGFNSFDNEAFCEYNPQNMKQLDIENSIKKFDSIVNSFQNNEVSLNLNIEVQSKCYPDEFEQNKIQEKEYTKIGDYIQMKEGDMLERSYKYIDTNLPCVPFSFAHTQKHSIMGEEQVQLDSIEKAEKDFIKSNADSEYNNEYKAYSLKNSNTQDEPETTNDQTHTGPTSRREMNPSMSYNNTASHTCSVIESVSEPDSSKKTTQSEKQEIELMKALRQQCCKNFDKTQTNSFDLQNNKKIQEMSFMNLTQGTGMKVSDFEGKLQMVQSSNGNYSLSKSSSEKQYIDDGSSETSSANKDEEQGDSTVRKMAESVQCSSFDSSKKPFEYKEVCPTEREEDPQLFKSIEKHQRLCSMESNMTDKTVFKSDIKTDRSSETVVNTVCMSANV